MRTPPPRLTKTDCLLWKQNPTRSPISGRAIKKGSSLYVRLYRTSWILGVVPPQDEPHHCDSKSYVIYSADEAQLYDKTTTARCGSCNHCLLILAFHATEEELGDYVCNRCAKDVKITYYCGFCKKSQDA